MVRGRPAKVGDERVSANGYWYVRTKDEWRLKHHIIAEQSLGRKLKENERVSFKDGDRNNLDPSNLKVAKQRNRKKERVQQLRAKIRVLQDELKELEQEGYR